MKKIKPIKKTSKIPSPPKVKKEMKIKIPSIKDTRERSTGMMLDILLASYDDIQQSTCSIMGDMIIMDLLSRFTDEQFLQIQECFDEIITNNKLQALEVVIKDSNQVFCELLDAQESDEE